MKLRWPWGKTYQVECPDGTTKTVYRNIDDALPLAIRGWKGGGEADVNALQQATAKLRTEYATQIHGLLYNIDSFNSSSMMHVRFAYLAFQSDPCADRGTFQRTIEGVINDYQRHIRQTTIIRGLIELATNHPNQPEIVFGAFREAVVQLGNLAAPQAARLEINEVRTLAREWTEGNRGS